jgi:predicted kinase
MKSLFLVRGLPGSGKSTLAKKLSDNHLEADMFFLNDQGKYVFDSSKLAQAHEWCQKGTEIAMLREASTIAVSNTFTQEWEMEPYRKLAEKYGYQVFSIIVENRHEGKNVHSVPDQVLETMKNRFQIKL